MRGLVCRDRAGHWGGGLRWAGGEGAWGCERFGMQGRGWALGGGRVVMGWGGEGAWGCERFGMQGQGWALGGGGCDGLGGRGHGVVRGLVCRDRAGHWGGRGVVMDWGGRGHGVVRGLVCRNRAGHWGGWL